MSPEKENELYRLVGESIKAFRIKSGISQDQLASLLGFSSRISIANIESAKQRVQLHTLIEICDIFKIPITSIVISLDFLNNKKVDSKLAKNITKEISDDISIEKIKDFINFSSSKQKL